MRIVVGDGRSDFCMAARADLVLAKASLLEHCASAALPHCAFADFSEATELLAGWLEGHAPVRPSEAHSADE
jgi:2-hydroxy-3-keto-5-methylthiopentenyl-1-phosphate phosphatase